MTPRAGSLDDPNIPGVCHLLDQPTLGKLAETRRDSALRETEVDDKRVGRGRLAESIAQLIPNGLIGWVAKLRHQHEVQQTAES